MSFIIKHIAKKKLGYLNQWDDPFTEEYFVEKKSFLSGATKKVAVRRSKPIPSEVPVSERNVILKLRDYAYKMELMFKIFGTRYGWLNIVKLVPVIGDVIALLLSFRQLLLATKSIGNVPLDIAIICALNIIFDFVLNLIPIIGDIISLAYKPNVRNTIILEEYIVKKYVGYLPQKEPLTGTTAVETEEPALHKR